MTKGKSIKVALPGVALEAGVWEVSQLIVFKIQNGDRLPVSGLKRSVSIVDKSKVLAVGR